MIIDFQRFTSVRFTHSKSVESYDRQFVFWLLFQRISPGYNRNGWLGVKHQVTYLITSAYIFLKN